MHGLENVKFSFMFSPTRYMGQNSSFILCFFFTKNLIISSKKKVRVSDENIVELLLS